jgi:tetratricopeptide (TPR) repeat protein
MSNGKTFSLRLLLSAAIVSTIVPIGARAEVPGVSTLIEQGQYWQSKGRRDLANQAFRRALVLDPNNGEARRGLAGQGARPTTKTPAAPPAAARPAVTPQPEPRTSRAAQPARTGGDARAAGFRALDNNQLDEAEGLFTRAMSRNRSDADAQGGLGLVRLRQGRFGEARDLLDQATRLGGPAKWSEALASARFYGGLADARILLADGRIAEAQSQAEGLARSGFAQRGPALELLAEIYERQGRYADAADMYRQASEGSPDGGNRLRSRAGMTSKPSRNFKQACCWIRMIRGSGTNLRAI